MVAADDAAGLRHAVQPDVAGLEDLAALVIDGEGGALRGRVARPGGVGGPAVDRAVHAPVVAEDGGIPAGAGKDQLPRVGVQHRRGVLRVFRGVGEQHEGLVVQVGEQVADIEGDLPSHRRILSCASCAVIV